MGQTQSSELGHENEALGLGLSVIKIITNEIQFAVHYPVHASIMATRGAGARDRRNRTLFKFIYRPHTTQKTRIRISSRGKRATRVIVT